MALTSSSQGSSGGSCPHPGDSKAAHPCGLTFSEVLGVPVSQPPPLSPAPGGAWSWFWTRALGVLSGMDPSGCTLLLALISVSLTTPGCTCWWNSGSVSLLTVSGAMDAASYKHLELLPCLRPSGTGLLVDGGVVFWSNFLLLTHLPLGSSQPLLLHDEYVPICTQRYRKGAEKVHVNPLENLNHAL